MYLNAKALAKTTSIVISLSIIKMMKYANCIALTMRVACVILSMGLLFLVFNRALMRGKFLGTARVI